jgi:hypothetical protein
MFKMRIDKYEWETSLIDASFLNDTALGFIKMVPTKNNKKQQ